MLPVGWEPAWEFCLLLSTFTFSALSSNSYKGQDVEAAWGVRGQVSWWDSRVSWLSRYGWGKDVRYYIGFTDEESEVLP